MCFTMPPDEADTEGVQVCSKGTFVLEDLRHLLLDAEPQTSNPFQNCIKSQDCRASTFVIITSIIGRS